MDNVYPFLLAMCWWVVPITIKIQGWPKTLEKGVRAEFQRVVNELSEKGSETWTTIRSFRERGMATGHAIDPQDRQALEEVDLFGSEIYCFIDVVFREEEDVLRWARSDLKELANYRRFCIKEHQKKTKNGFSTY